jgi:ABC-2 type transport system ATP-binding protein
MEDFVLRTEGLIKIYRGRRVLDGVNINIRRGGIYGFVGENGSGKTTVIRAISGLIFPDGGSFELFGVPCESDAIGEARRRTGAIVESPSIYLGMSARENLRMQCGVLGIDDSHIKDVLCEVGLAELYDDPKKAGNFSLGMRQRLGLAMCLLGNPEFIMLDEPMNGLDPAGIVGVRELIIKLNRERGITFMISGRRRFTI